MMEELCGGVWKVKSKVNGEVWKVVCGGENWEKKRKKLFYYVDILL